MVVHLVRLAPNAGRDVDKITPIRIRLCKMTSDVIINNRGVVQIESS